MKFYNSRGPNPRLVRMFIAEKGIAIPTQEIDLRAGENRQPEHLKRNPHGQTPALELDSGQFVCEVLAICEYLDEINPSPPLIGTTAEERAETRMWMRRIDLNICEHLANGFRFGEGLKMFAPRIVTVPEASAGLKKIAQDRIAWLDGQIAGEDYICGKRFTLADMLLFVWLDFFATVGQPIEQSNKNVVALYERVKQRPSAQA